MGEYLNRQQRKASDYLAARTAGISRSGWITILTVFLCAGIFCNVYILLTAFSADKYNVFSGIKEIKRPKYIEDLGDGILRGDPLTPKEREEFFRFRHWLDSLENSEEGRSTYDSIVRVRPGLVDSLDIIIQQLKSSEYEE